jgi:hypothetical protein
LLKKVDPKPRWVVGRANESGGGRHVPLTYSVLFVPKDRHKPNVSLAHHVNFVFDANSLKLEGFSILDGYRLEPKAERALTERQAGEKAIQLVKQTDPKLPTKILMVRRITTLPIEGFGVKRGDPMLNSKLMYDCYEVRFEKCIIQVSARDGSPRGGFITSKTPPGAMKKVTH